MLAGSNAHAYICAMPNPLLYIRKTVLGLTQREMAVLTGTKQATVSRWETGELEPDREQMKAIRDEAARREVPWDDGWFFSVPEEAAA